MMVHPFPHDAVFLGSLATKFGYITYKGKSSHASLFPYEGINALDAAVMAYSGVSMMRQQMKPTWRVHGVILEGGIKCTVIPSTTKMEYCLRAPNRKELDELEAKVTGCFNAAAQATGWWHVGHTSFLHWTNKPYLTNKEKTIIICAGLTRLGNCILFNFLVTSLKKSIFLFWTEKKCVLKHQDPRLSSIL